MQQRFFKGKLFFSSVKVPERSLLPPLKKEDLRGLKVVLCGTFMLVGQFQFRVDASS
jgi:hypothetical protein